MALKTLSTVPLARWPENGIVNFGTKFKKETTEHIERIRDTVRRSDVNVEELGVGLWHLYDEFRSHFQTRLGSAVSEV